MPDDKPMSKPEPVLGLNPVLARIRVMGILATVALSHAPDCNCEAVCRRLKELHRQHRGGSHE